VYETVTNKPGFFYGWVIVAVGGTLLFLAWGFQYSFGVFFTELCQDLNWTRTMVSGAFSLFMLWHSIIYLFAGRLNDRYGPRLTSAICIISLSIGYALMSIISAPWQLYIFYGIIIGTGGGFGVVPITSTVSRWFTEKRGMAIGIVLAGVGLGTLALSPFTQFLISSFDWRSSYLIIAGVLLVIGLPISRLMRLQPSDKGLLPYGKKEMLNENKQDNLLSAIDFTLKQAIKTRAFWLIFILYILIIFVVQMVMVHLKDYATVTGITPMVAATILGIVGGASIPGRIVMGSISDKIGRKSAFLISSILLAVMMLWLMQATDTWQFYLFSVVFGFSYGGITPLVPAIIADWFGMKNNGTILGATMLAPGIGGAIGPLLGGYICDKTGTYDIAFLIGAVVAFIAAACSLALKSPTARSD